MVSPTDLAYIAGLFDGEAHIGIKKSRAYECQARTTPGYHARIGIRMVDEAAIRFVAETLGGWYYKEKRALPNRRVLYAYQATDKRAADILAALLPYLRVKRAVAETVMALRAMQADGRKHRTKVTGYRDFQHWTGKIVQMPNLSYSDDYVARCDALHARCKELNAVGDAAA